MKKTLIFLLVLTLLAVGGCADAGDAITYDAAHEHVYGFWYDAQDDGGARRQVRYCKICHAEQVQTLPSE